MNMHKRFSGFTIVEIVVIVVVVAVLAATITVGYGAVRKNAERSAVAASLTQVEDIIEKKALQSGAKLPVNLDELSVEIERVQPEGYAVDYIAYNDRDHYCLSLDTEDGSGVSQYITSYDARSPRDGTCSEPESLGGEFLGYAHAESRSTPFGEIDAYSDVTLYSAFEIFSMDAAWGSMSRINGMVRSLQLDQNNTGLNSLRVRADTSESSNAVITQSGVRGNGRHVGWAQVRSGVTELGLAYDSPVEFNRRTLIPGDGMRLHTVTISNASAAVSPLASLAFKKAHNEEERSRVLTWLARQYDVSINF